MHDRGRSAGLLCCITEGLRVECGYQEARVEEVAAWHLFLSLQEDRVDAGDFLDAFNLSRTGWTLTDGTSKDR